MKINKNLFMMLFVLSVGSAANVQAACAKCDTVAVSEVSSPSFKDKMHEIQRAIHDVRMHAQDNVADVSCSALDAIAQRVEALNNDVKGASKEYADMYSVHINTLKREIKDARQYVKKHAKTANVNVQRRAIG